jgi:hypothetical protein
LVLTSSTSFGALTCVAGYLIFNQIKLSQMMNWSAPLQRACRDNQIDILFAIFGAQNQEILIPHQNQVEKNIEDTRRCATEGGAHLP